MPTATARRAGGCGHSCRQSRPIPRSRLLKQTGVASAPVDTAICRIEPFTPRPESSGPRQPATHKLENGGPGGLAQSEACPRGRARECPRRAAARRPRRSLRWSRLLLLLLPLVLQPPGAPGAAAEARGCCWSQQLPRTRADGIADRANSIDPAFSCRSPWL